jgi:hypothetical protein
MAMNWFGLPQKCASGSSPDLTMYWETRFLPGYFFYAVAKAVVKGKRFGYYAHKQVMFGRFADLVCFTSSSEVEYRNDSLTS